jgi:hypothetical protein
VVALTGEKRAEADDGDAAARRGDGGEVGRRGQLGDGAAPAGAGGRGRSKRRHGAAANGRLRGFRRSPEVEAGMEEVSSV